MEMSDNEGERQLKRKIIRLKDNLRAKYKSLKRADQDEKTFIAESFRPLVEPLESLVKEIENKPSELAIKRD
jgi:hypothetical protein